MSTLVKVGHVLHITRRVLAPDHIRHSALISTTVTVSAIWDIVKDGADLWTGILSVVRNTVSLFH